MKYKVLIFFAHAPLPVWEMLTRLLRWENYEVRWATNDREALELAQDQWPDLLLLDFNRPLKRALNSFEPLEAMNRFAPIILITEKRTDSAPAVADRVAALIQKPFEVSLLLRTMRAVLNPLAAAAGLDALGQHALALTRTHE